MKSITEDAGRTRNEAAEPRTTREGPVVIVDDDPYDSLLAEGVIDGLDPAFPVQILASGEDLLAYLQGENLYHDRAHYPYPGLILLDLMMPGMNGFEVLKWIKEHPSHSKIPIVVLSGTIDMPGQVTKAYQMGADSFLPKPVQAKDIQSILSVLKVSI
jgi:CheY-like chemotaxis protein